MIVKRGFNRLFSPSEAHVQLPRETRRRWARERAIKVAVAVGVVVGLLIMLRLSANGHRKLANDLASCAVGAFCLFVVIRALRS